MKSFYIKTKVSDLDSNTCKFKADVYIKVIDCIYLFYLYNVYKYHIITVTIDIVKKQKTRSSAIYKTFVVIYNDKISSKWMYSR